MCACGGRNVEMVTSNQLADIQAAQQAAQAEQVQQMAASQAAATANGSTSSQ